MSIDSQETERRKQRMEESTALFKPWELHDAMFSVDQMLCGIRMYAETKNLQETQRALPIMLKYHEGAVRKSIRGETVPYVIHPLMMACHAIALGIAQDELIAAILLHDVVEDTEATLEDLAVNDTVKQVVELVSFRIFEGMTKEESKKLYYEKISRNRIASVVKLLDRCNNVSTMAMGFPRQKMAQYIFETETYVFPLLERLKDEYHEYAQITFLLKYQLLSVMESIKRMIN